MSSTFNSCCRIVGSVARGPGAARPGGALRISTIDDTRSRSRHAGLSWSTIRLPAIVRTGCHAWSRRRRASHAANPPMEASATAPTPPLTTSEWPETAANTVPPPSPIAPRGGTHVQRGLRESRVSRTMRRDPTDSRRDPMRIVIVCDIAAAPPPATSGRRYTQPRCHSQVPPRPVRRRGSGPH